MVKWTYDQANLKLFQRSLQGFLDLSVHFVSMKAKKIIAKKTNKETYFYEVIIKYG